MFRACEPMRMMHMFVCCHVYLEYHLNISKFSGRADRTCAPGVDHLFYVGENADEISDAIEEFLTGSRAPVEAHGGRLWATVCQPQGEFGWQRLSRYSGGWSVLT